MDKTITDLTWMQDLLTEALALGLKLHFPASQVAGFVFALAHCDKQLKAQANREIDARFRAKLASPECAGVPQKFRLVR